MRGKLIIVSGPSGSGKSTVTKIVKDKLNIPLSISATTRNPRDGEIDGKDYFFLSKEEFKNKIANDEFYEYAEVHGNYYGTPKDMDILEKRLRDRKTDSEEVIQTRLKNAEAELKYEDKYNYTIINENLDDSIQELIDIIEG